jgi:conjugal transfer pilin signal peptidase TrbI
MLNKFYNHFAKWYPLYIWIVALTYILGSYYTVSFNFTQSLPGTVFLVSKDTNFTPEKGMYIVFRPPQAEPYAHGTEHFLKIVKGVPGSVVTSKPIGGGYTDFFVDGQSVGIAKPISLRHLPLEPGHTGVIPEGQYYVAGTHADSFDSRYAVIGWIDRKRLIGRAYKVF